MFSQKCMKYDEKTLILEGLNPGSIQELLDFGSKTSAPPLVVRSSSLRSLKIVG
jgi:hypothetical protein